VTKWTKVFYEYGTHVVHCVYGGGAIQIKLKNKGPFDAKMGEALFDLIKFADDMAV